mmetsp:Transcript_16274/g.24102  ORF Transcript_16274/g.24102 Transcript_16274/m.24102 type:complete len:168 (+) Transcript_16274:82-585(+)
MRIGMAVLSYRLLLWAPGLFLGSSILSLFPTIDGFARESRCRRVSRHFSIKSSNNIFLQATSSSETSAITKAATTTTTTTTYSLTRTHTPQPLPVPSLFRFQHNGIGREDLVSPSAIRPEAFRGLSLAKNALECEHRDSIVTASLGLRAYASGKLSPRFCWKPARST